MKNAIRLNEHSVISLLADKSNNIYASESGILATKGSTASMIVHYHESDESNLESTLKNNIFVNKEYFNDEDAFGVKAIDGSIINITSQDNTEVSDQDKKYIPTINTTINVQAISGNVIGIIADDSSNTTGQDSQIKIDGNNLSIIAMGLINDNSSEKISAIESISDGTRYSKVDATLLSDIDVSVSGNTQNGYGLKAENGGVIILNSTNGGYVNINVNTDNVNQQTGYGIYSSGDVDVTSVKNTIIASLDGVNFSSGTVDITSSATSLLSRSIDKVSDYNIIIGSDGTGVHAAKGADGEFNAIATSGDNCIAGAENAIWSEPSEEVKEPKILVKAEYGSNLIGFDKYENVDGVVGKNGIYAQSGEVTIKAGVGNVVNSYQKGIFVDNLAKVNLISGELNLITANDTSKKNTYEYFGNGYAIYSSNEGSVTLEAGDTNQLVGAVYASGSDTNVFIGGSEEDENRAARENLIYSYAYISGAGDLGDDPEGAFGGKNVISALYAEGGANIELSG
ncbi:hypothetical protein, partial [Succinatimonas hippei]|uniref:hypothetical protein n=1 Tax=Succinatimonas hippei TaxID=626938 RepID=UPI0023F9061F